MDHCRRIQILALNRSLIFLAAGLSYSSWSGWYQVFEVEKSLERKIGFTVTVLVALFFVSIWYHRHQTWLQRATDELLAETAPTNPSREDDIDGDSDADVKYHVVMVHVAALLEKSFENITNAMSFVMAEVWAGDISATVQHNWLASCAMGLLGLALMVLFTVAQRAVDPSGNCHAYLELLSGLVLGSMAWFICVPTRDLFREWAGIPEGDAPPLWLGLLAFLAALVFLSLSTWMMARCCWPDEEKKEDEPHGDEDGSEAVTSMDDAMGLISHKRRPLCAQGVVMYQNVYFNVAASLLKDWLMVEGHDTFALTLITIVVADAIFICCDSNTQLPQDADEAKSRAWIVRVRADAVSLTTRVAAYLSSHVFAAHTLNRIEEGHPVQKVIFCVVTQTVAVIMEELRMRCIVRKGLLAGIGNVWEAMEEDEEDSEESGEDDSYSPMKK